MNSSVLLDKLISESSGNTLYYYMSTCPSSLLKEAILRGYEIFCLDNITTEDGLVGCFRQEQERELYIQGRGGGFGNGCAEYGHVWWSGAGYGAGYGLPPYLYSFLFLYHKDPESEVFGSEGERELMDKSIWEKRMMLRPKFSSKTPLDISSIINFREEEYWIG